MACSSCAACSACMPRPLLLVHQPASVMTSGLSGYRRRHAVDVVARVVQRLVDVLVFPHRVGVQRDEVELGHQVAQLVLPGHVVLAEGDRLAHRGLHAAHVLDHARAPARSGRSSRPWPRCPPRPRTRCRGSALASAIRRLDLGVVLGAVRLELLLAVGRRPRGSRSCSSRRPGRRPASPGSAARRRRSPPARARRAGCSRTGAAAASAAQDRAGPRGSRPSEG